MTLARIIIVGAASVALTACGQPQPVLILPPATLAQCADAPAVPTLPALKWDGLGSELAKDTPEISVLRGLFMEATEAQKARDKITSTLWLDERAAGSSCRSKVRGLNAWMKEAK